MIVSTSKIYLFLITKIFHFPSPRLPHVLAPLMNLFLNVFFFLKGVHVRMLGKFTRLNEIRFVLAGRMKVRGFVEFESLICLY